MVSIDLEFIMEFIGIFLNIFVTLLTKFSDKIFNEMIDFLGAKTFDAPFFIAFVLIISVTAYLLMEKIVGRSR